MRRRSEDKESRMGGGEIRSKGEKKRQERRGRGRVWRENERKEIEQNHILSQQSPALLLCVYEQKNVKERRNEGRET